jgi:hypothetical protein
MKKDASCQVKGGATIKKTGSHSFCVMVSCQLCGVLFSSTTLLSHLFSLLKIKIRHERKGFGHGNFRIYDLPIDWLID